MNMYKWIAIGALAVVGFTSSTSRAAQRLEASPRTMRSHWFQRFTDDALVQEHARAIDAQLGDDPRSPESLTIAERIAGQKTDLFVSGALRCDLADYYRDRARLSRNIDHLSKTWESLSGIENGPQRKIADYALAQLVFSLSSVGRVEDLRRIFAQTQGRDFSNLADYQVYTRAKEAYLIMLSQPGIAYRCGTAALYEIGEILGVEESKLNSLSYVDSPVGGFTLARLTEVSANVGLKMTPIRIDATAPIPVPSVVHWKSDHYAAIKRATGSSFEIVDHTLGLHAYMSEDEIRDETTGDFLVSESMVQPGWSRLSAADASLVVGRGYPNMIRDEKDLGCKNSVASGCGSCRGMPNWLVSEPYINVWIEDVPLFYKATDGEIEFRLSSHARDPRITDWPTKWSANVAGTPWLNNWGGYVKVKAKGSSTPYFKQGYTAKVYLPSGGKLTFEDTKCFDPDSGAYFFPVFPYVENSGALNITTNMALGFKLQFPDGTVCVFGGSSYLNSFFSDAVGNAAQNIEAFLNEWIDPKGRTNRFFFENGAGVSSFRLSMMVDYDGKTNSLTYTNIGTINDRFWYVQSPYGAIARLGYDSNGRVTSITDAVALKSTIAYNPSTFAVTNFVTPYGTNSFEYFESGNYDASTNNAAGHDVAGNLLVNRAVRVIDANGGKHLYMYRYAADGLLPTSFPSSQIPANQTDLPLPLLSTLDTGGSSFASLEFRNSFYWNPKTDPGTLITQLTNLTTSAYDKARWRHWLVETDPTVVTTSSALSFERSGATSDTATGAVVWYNYDGKPSPERVGTQHRPGLIAARLENGETTYQRYTYNDWGLVGTMESTYRPSSGADITTNGTTFTYVTDIFTDTIWALQGDPLYVSNQVAQFKYTNLFLNTIAKDGISVLGLGTYSGYTNSVDYTNSFGDGKRIVTTGRYGQPKYATNALQERFADITYGEKMRTESVLTPTSLVEFKYFTSGTDIGKLDSIIENNASTNRFTYAANGTLGSIQTPLGLMVTTTFDYFHRPVQITFPAQAGSHAASSILYSYTLASGTNPTGGTDLLDVTKITDRQGNDTKFEYMPLRAVKKITDRENRVTEYLYNCSCGALGAISNSLQVISFEYDLQSRLTNVIYPDLTNVRYEYTSYGQLKKVSESTTNFVSYTYNNQGLLASVNNQFGAAWIGGYNADGQLVRVTNGASLFLGVDKLGRLVTTAYNDSDAWMTNQTWGFTSGIFPPTSYKNALNEITYYGYDNFERLRSVVQENLSTNTFDYNAVGQIASITSPLGGKTGWVFDTEGRVSQKTNDVGTTLVSYYYFPNGWVSNRVDALNNNVKYAYDKVGNVKTNIYTGRSESFTYDDMNRLTGMTDSVGTHAFTYVNGFLSTEDGPWASDTLTYQYSHLQRSKLTTQGLYGNRDITYSYDEAGRLKNVTSPAGTFGYDYAGGLLAALPGLPGRLNLPGGGLITNLFNHPANLLTRTALRNPSGGESLASGFLYDLAWQLKTNFHSDTTKTIYDYYPHGSLKAAFGQETNNAARAQENLSYGYDPAGNLTGRTNAGLVQLFSTNKLNQIASAQATGTITVSGYTSPNATAVTVNGVSATLNADKTFYRASVPVTDATFTAVATAGSFSATDIVTNVWASSITPTYDAFGNLRAFGNRIFGYDEENRLNSVIITNSSSDSKKVEFTYDGLGRKRVRKEFKWQSSSWVSAGSGETRYVYDGGLIIEERNGNNQTLVQYTRGADITGTRYGAGGIGGLLARSDYGVHSYYVNDRGGNIAGLVDKDGKLRAQYTYEPYGRLAESSGPIADANHFQYSSREYDPTTGLYDFGGRFYDPALQRWLNPDPIGEIGGWNLYSFTGNRPVNAIDVDGDYALSLGFLFVDSVRLVRNISNGTASAADGWWVAADAVALAADIFTGGTGGTGLELAMAGSRAARLAKAVKAAKLLSEADALLTIGRLGAEASKHGDPFAFCKFDQSGPPADAPSSHQPRFLAPQKGPATDLAPPDAFGKVTPPAGLTPGTTKFGNAMHQKIKDMLESMYPGVQMDFRIKPGQNGVDVTVLEGGESVTGFKYADIKPRNPAQQLKLQRQVENWGYKPDEVLPITYDAAGNVFKGF